jgi:hypothetical protein
MVSTIAPCNTMMQQDAQLVCSGNLTPGKDLTACDSIKVKP